MRQSLLEVNDGRFDRVVDKGILELTNLYFYIYVYICTHTRNRE